MGRHHPSAAQGSLEWFEGIGRYMGQDPRIFACNLLTRSRRITYTELQLRDPEFIASFDAFGTGPLQLAPDGRSLIFVRVDNSWTLWRHRLAARPAARIHRYLADMANDDSIARAAPRGLRPNTSGALGVRAVVTPRRPE